MKSLSLLKVRSNRDNAYCLRKKLFVVLCFSECFVLCFAHNTGATSARPQHFLDRWFGGARKAETASDKAVSGRSRRLLVTEDLVASKLWPKSQGEIIKVKSKGSRSENALVICTGSCDDVLNSQYLITINPIVRQNNSEVYVMQGHRTLRYFFEAFLEKGDKENPLGPTPKILKTDLASIESKTSKPLKSISTVNIQTKYAIDYFVTPEGYELLTSHRRFDIGSGAIGNSFETIVNLDGKKVATVRRDVDIESDGSTTIVLASAFFENVEIGPQFTRLQTGEVMSVIDFATLRQVTTVTGRGGVIKRVKASFVDNERTLLEFILSLSKDELSKLKQLGPDDLKSTWESYFDRMVASTHTTRYVLRMCDALGLKVSNIHTRMPEDLSGQLRTLESFITEGEKVSRISKLAAEAKKKFCPNSACDEIQIPFGMDLFYDVQ